MADFLPCSAPLRAAAPEPHKHVNYGLGMVLGVDDYTQEFAYLASRLQWLTRDLLGYGVVHGLDVSRSGAQIVIAAGVAITPRGQLVYVPFAQTADLDLWLQRHRREVDSALSSPPSTRLTLYLTLKYCDRLTDNEPVPGRPCRDEEPPMLPSRVQDDFLLELRFHPPHQDEEDAVRDFVAWLRQIQVTTLPGASTSLPDFLNALRQAAHLSSSPPGSPPLSPPSSPPLSPPLSPPESSPDYMYGSPPGGLRIPEAGLCEYLSAAFQLWVTELRSLWARRSEACISRPPSEERVLLATLHVQVGPGENGHLAVVSIDEPDVSRAPYLIHAQLLQEWLLCGWRAPLVEPGDGITPERAFGLSKQPGASDRYAREDHTHGTPDLPALPAPATTIVEERQFGLLADSGNLSSYAREDHTHGTPNLPAISSPLIAAGRFTFDGSPEFTFGDLTALQSPHEQRLYWLLSQQESLTSDDIVKGTPINQFTNKPATFEVLDLTDADIQKYFDVDISSDPKRRGIFVRVSLVDGTTTQMGFMVEISRYK